MAFLSKALMFVSEPRVLVITAILLMAAVVASPVVLMTFVFSQEPSPSNEVKMIKSVASPGGAFVANYYVLTGGGAAGYVSHFVNVSKASTPFDRNRGVVVQFRDGELDELAWSGSSTLTVKVLAHPTHLIQSPPSEEFENLKVQVVNVPRSDLRP